jgi:hypothetical protein
MGKIKSGILGGFSGKVGPVVGGAWKGINYVRSSPVSVANPNTVAQAGQRTKFSTVVEIGKALLGTIVQPFWNPIAQKMSGFNDFVKSNIDAAIAAGGVTWANLKISRGALQPVAAITCVSDDSSNSHVISWVVNSGTGNALAGDVTIAAIYNRTQDYWVPSVGAQSRGFGSCTIVDNKAQVGDAIEAYLGFHRANDNSLCSDSKHVSTVVVA